MRIPIGSWRGELAAAPGENIDMLGHHCCTRYTQVLKMAGAPFRCKKDFRMRAAAPTIALVAALLLATAAPAQVLVPEPPPPPVNQEGMRSFCIHGNQIYSLGAELCVANGNVALRCVPSEGSKSDGRAFWSFESKEWPLSPGLHCGAGP